LACLPDDPRKIRGLFMRDSPLRSRDEGQRTRLDPVDHTGTSRVRRCWNVPQRSGVTPDFEQSGACCGPHTSFTLDSQSER
jgi:hypothetical protein